MHNLALRVWQQQSSSMAGATTDGGSKGAGSCLLSFNALCFVLKNRKNTIGRKVPYFSYRFSIFFLLLIPTKKRKNAKSMQNHNFVSTLRSTQERPKTHDADFCRKDWRERKTLCYGASTTTLLKCLNREHLLKADNSSGRVLKNKSGFSFFLFFSFLSPRK
jgi:hypothetical protein